MNQPTALLESSKNQNGRKLTTGKYDTRDELVGHVIRLKNEGRLSKTSIGRICGVSGGTIDSILNMNIESNSNNKISETEQGVTKRTFKGQGR